MKITLAAAGGFGDTLPLVFLGQGLLAAGHDVTLLCATDVVPMLDAGSLPVQSYDIDIASLMGPEVIDRWQSSDEAEQLAVVDRWTRAFSENVIDALIDGFRHSDAVIVGPVLLTTALVVRRRIPTPLVLLQHTPSVVGPRGDSLFLRTDSSVSWARTLAVMPRMLRWLGALNAGGRVAADRLGMRTPAPTQQLAATTRLPVMTVVSPLVAPAHGPAHRTTPTTGFLLPQDSPPLSGATQRFLDAGDAPVHVGLGSSATDTAAARLGEVVDTLVDAGARVVVQRATGVPETHDPSRVHLIDFEPFARLFPRCSLAIHQGGSGSLAHALVAGTPQATITLTADHAYFGRRAHELGVATPPVHLQRVTAEDIRASWDFALATQTQEHAADVARRIGAEDGVGNAVRFVERVLQRR